MGLVMFMSLLTLSMLLYLCLILRRVRGFSGHGPPNYPIIGCLVSFYKNQHRLLDWYTDLLAESTTQTIVVHRLGAPRTIVTANPSNIEYILKTNFDNFPKGKPFAEILGDFLGSGIFSVDGELWQAQRKLASHEFSTKSLQEFVLKTMKDEVEERLLPLLESLAGKENVAVDLQELLRRLAFDMVCRVSLGFDPCCLDRENPSPPGWFPLARAFDTASQICARRGAAPIFVIWKIKRWIGIGSERELKKAIGEVHEFVGRIIEKRKEKAEGSSTGQDDLLGRLVCAGHEEEVIRDMVISFIMAGRDTTSAAMTWLFWLLSHHPDIEQEVVEEVRSGMGDRELVTYESLKEMRLLKACLCETMRLYPPVAWDSKYADGDDLLPDSTPVRKGDRVTYFPYGMARMEGLWGKDRFRFKPDRWFDEPSRERRTLKQVCPYKFPVFQAGPRMCLGKEMAFVQMKYVVASVLRRFSLRPVGVGGPPAFVPLLTAHMAGGFKVVVCRR
ncbi:cytochrome P450 94B3 [Malania oleifera]|uniref:cytochrome P450 94B3 n=1 Tax=Malania oleifera TaxID=397392 RepID=UPI0025ADBABA|nr:cytochrome P450 94B3 [Malania oleifera]